MSFSDISYSITPTALPNSYTNQLFLNMMPNHHVVTYTEPKLPYVTRHNTNKFNSALQTDSVLKQL